MARNGGLGALIAILGLAFLLSDRKIGAEAFVPTFAYPTIPRPREITYRQYFEFATAPQREVEEDPETELTVSMPITQTATKLGVWRTIGGKIPTPTGGLIPLPTVHVGRVAVEKMLEPIGGESPAEYFADVEYNGKVRRAVGARLKPL
ncbi:unnamed protein product [marine sediment metagenome]|uniref:Uncharacterized protein n=1 Tax=marine sediment metagenome TaxID=412755 RepID=X1JUL0_9ZZZZ